MADAPNSALAAGRPREQGLAVERVHCARIGMVGSAWLESPRREVIGPVRYRVRPDEVAILCEQHRPPNAGSWGAGARAAIGAWALGIGAMPTAANASGTARLSSAR